VARTVGRLLPAERRDWAEAIWAEASEVPSALGRVGWLTGGIWLIAKESFMVSRVRNSIMFAAAAAFLAWMAWQGTASGWGTTVVRVMVTITVLALAALPRLARRRLGPAIDSRIARSLRAGGYASVLALIVALVELERIKDVPSRLARLGPHNQPSIGLWFPWGLFLLMLAGYVAVILAVTAQRSRVTPGTLAIGGGGGVALGVVMYVIMPLGVGQYATAPWLPGSDIDPVVAVAWFLLLGGPLAAALLAGRRCSGSAGPLPPAEAMIRQGVAAGILVTLVGSLVVCALGPATLANLGALTHLLYPGQHLNPSAVANREYALAGNGAPFYILIWIAFPIIGLGIGAITALCAWGNQSARQQGRGPGGGPGDPDAEPGPPPAGPSADLRDEGTSVAAGLYIATRGS